MMCVYVTMHLQLQGTYGLVFRAKDKKTGEEVALKQIKFDSRHTSKVGFPITALRETNILLALRHPNIVRVKEMVVGSSVDKIYMVMEFLENDLKACMDMSKTPFSISEVGYDRVCVFCLHNEGLHGKDACCVNMLHNHVLYMLLIAR
jgi:serine/threonine protein kinase